MLSNGIICSLGAITIIRIHLFTPPYLAEAYTGCSVYLILTLAADVQWHLDKRLCVTCNYITVGDMPSYSPVTDVHNVTVVNRHMLKRWL